MPGPKQDGGTRLLLPLLSTPQYSTLFEHTAGFINVSFANHTGVGCVFRYCSAKGKAVMAELSSVWLCGVCGQEADL